MLSDAHRTQADDERRCATRGCSATRQEPARSAKPRQTNHSALRPPRRRVLLLDHRVGRVLW